MEQDVKNSTRVCQRPPGLLTIGLSTNTGRMEIIVAAGLITVLSVAALSTYLLWGPPPREEWGPELETPYGFITIDGDANFSDTALLEGWPGDGSPENPFVIDGLDIDLTGGVGHCMSISDTRVSFTISNCNLAGANLVIPFTAMGLRIGAGIFLENVTNGELVNNTCNSNNIGISLSDSLLNTLANNTCFSNGECGISLGESDHNTVANNTCTDNGNGIVLRGSDANTLVNNTCNNNGRGILLERSDSNTVANNICTSNEFGISIDVSHSNTVENNICSSNTEYGISLYESDDNIVANNNCNHNRIGIYLYVLESMSTPESNIFSDNTIDIYIHEVRYETMYEAEEFDPEVLQFIGFVGVMGFTVITFLGAGWRMAKLSNVVSKGG